MQHDDPTHTEGSMIKARRLTAVVAIALSCALMFGAFPAMAEPAPSTVAYHVFFCGTDLFGMDATQAHDAVAAACTSDTLKPLATRAAGVTYTLDVATAVVADADAMAAAALAATQDATLTPSVNTTAVTSFVAGVAKSAYKKPINAQRTVKKKRLKVTAPIDGRALDTTASITLVTDAITVELAAGGAAQPAVALPLKVLQAKGPLTLGKTIVVVLSERRLYLYKNSKLEKTFRCAVGQRRYPTPKGTWKIIKKVKNPSWHNNGSAWARKMPSFIGPGRNNPLGTRALYLNASGIRIHGIPASENSSIGHAASHGCIRLKNSNAVKLYPLVPVGTRVYIVG
jgi:lipoprotein-anchoring transpeptidase ErfK/SrfK